MLISSLLISILSLQLTSAQHTNRIKVEFRITGYTNSDLRLPDGKSCTSSFINPFSSHSPPKCRFQFDLYIPKHTFHDGKELKICSAYLNSTGQLPEESRDYWGYGHDLNAWKVPQSIHVRAKHSGWLYKGSDGPIVEQSNLTTVDEFIFSLKSLPSPSADNVIKLSNLTLLGNLLNTSLSASITISCISSSYIDGSFCDLSCTRSRIKEDVTSCTSESSGFSYLCEYVNDEKVVGCGKCEYGVKDDTYCQEWEWTMNFESLRQLTPEKVLRVLALLLCGLILSLAAILSVHFIF